MVGIYKDKGYYVDWTEWQGRPVPVAAIEREGFDGVKVKTSGRAKTSTHPADPFHVDPLWSANASALAQSPLLPIAFHYLCPGMPTAQAGLVLDLLDAHGGYGSWGFILDIEEPGVTYGDVLGFAEAWDLLTVGHPFGIYTRRNVWLNLPGGTGDLPTPYLEEAHWVPSEVRYDAATPYASQQAKVIQPDWWGGYGGVQRALGIQFTNHALVDGQYISSSLYAASYDQVRSMLLRG